MAGKRIKILHVQETVASGGVEKRRLLLVSRLDKSVYEQKLVCTVASGPIAEAFAGQGVKPVQIGKFRGIWDIPRYVKLIGIIREYRPDIIHGAVFEGVTMACVCGFLTRVPVVIAEETSDPQNRSRKADFLLRLLCKAADRMVAISEGTKRYLIERARIPASKVRLINNGCDLPNPVDAGRIEALKSELGIRPGDFVVGSVGRLSNDHKRFTDIIEAVASLGDRPDIKILIVGDGPDRKMIEECAERHGMSDRLIMAGYQWDTTPYYMLMDLFCLASSREGFGIVAAEAMFNRLPALVTSVGGLKYVVEEGETGYIVPPFAPQDLAARIDVLSRDAELCRRLGNNGYQRAMREYSPQAYVARVDGLYKECMQTIGGKEKKA